MVTIYVTLSVQWWCTALYNYTHTAGHLLHNTYIIQMVFVIGSPEGMRVQLHRSVNNMISLSSAFISIQSFLLRTFVLTSLIWLRIFHPSELNCASIIQNKVIFLFNWSANCHIFDQIFDQIFDCELSSEIKLKLFTKLCDLSAYFSGLIWFVKLCENPSEFICDQLCLRPFVNWFCEFLLPTTIPTWTPDNIYNPWISSPVSPFLWILFRVNFYIIIFLRF